MIAANTYRRLFSVTSLPADLTAAIICDRFFFEKTSAINDPWPGREIVSAIAEPRLNKSDIIE